MEVMIEEYKDAEWSGLNELRRGEEESLQHLPNLGATRRLMRTIAVRIRPCDGIVASDVRRRAARSARRPWRWKLALVVSVDPGAWGSWCAL